MLIDAVFFSCSGGRTESAVAVWGGEVPYLQAVDSPGEEDASAYVDTLRVSTEEFCRTLEALSDEIDLSGAPDTWVGETTLTDGGGVDTIEIGGVALEGTRLRSAFGLRSTKFELSVDETEACFTTFGFGHRVGMSQYGANAMAKNGASYDEILRYYYQGIDIVTLSQ
jgi:stage II sporulation protein D